MARKLERERNEARELFQTAMDLLKQYKDVSAEVRDAFAIATEERDRARDKIKHQAERIRILEGATNHAGGLDK